MVDKTFRSLANTLRVNQVTGYQNTDVAPAFRSFRTLAEVEAETIDDAGTGTLALVVTGHTEHGDCGLPMVFRYVVSEPTHVGKVQSDDGAWWENVTADVTPEMLGAPKTDGLDDASAINGVLAVKERVYLPGRYYLNSAVTIGRNQEIRGPGMGRDCIELKHVDARVQAAISASGFGAGLSGLRINGNGIASKCVVFGNQISQDAGIRDVKILDYVDVGLDIGSNTDQLVIDRLNITPARSAASTSCALKHVGPGPLYVTNSNLAAGAGVGIYSQSHGTFVNTRVNFFVNGLVKFEPVAATQWLNFIGPFFENTGFAHPDDGVPAGSPVAILCDGVNDASAGASGGIKIDSPQKVQAGWASTMFKAANGGVIVIDCHMPWQGKSGNRDLTAIEVAGPGSGSYIEFLGPWRYDDWDDVDYLGRVDPQKLEDGPPLRFDTATMLWEADLTTTDDWGFQAGKVTSLTAVDGTLTWTCSGTNASIYFDIPEAATARYVGKPLVLVAEFSHACPSGELYLNARLSVPPTPDPLPDPPPVWKAATLTKTLTPQSWDADEHGRTEDTLHAYQAFLADSGIIRASFGHDSGTDASSAILTFRGARLYALGVPGCP